MTTFSEIPDATYTASGCINIRARQRGTEDEYKAHQVLGANSIADFLQVCFGKPARKASLLLSSKKVIAMTKKKSYEIEILPD